MSAADFEVAMPQITALPFQRQTILDVEQKFGGRALIANEMGLGKTPTSLWYIKRKTLGETLPLLIVCPKIVRHQWIATVRQILDCDVDVLETRTPSFPSTLAPVQIINYDIIAWWRDWLEDRGFQSMIIDECQMCTNPERKRTKTTIALMKAIPYALALSGTPLENRPIELYPIIKALHPGSWPTKQRYGHKYCGPKYGYRGWDFSGASNTDELNVRLRQTCMIRYRKQDVLHELPDKVRTMIPVELSDREQYAMAQNDFIGWLRDNHPKRMSGAVRAAALVKQGHLLRLAARLKLKQVVKYINAELEAKPDGKVVIFAIHKKCVAALKRRIACNSVVIDGSTSQKNRQTALQRFTDDAKTRAVIGNLAAAGRGLNLVEANDAYMVELAQKPGLLLQGEDRIHRIGQEDTARIHYFIGRGTIETTVSKMLQKKQRNITTVLDGGTAEDEFELYNMLMEEVGNEVARPSTREQYPFLYRGRASSRS